MKGRGVKQTFSLHIMFKLRPKLCIIVLEDHENNLVQEKDNNVNGVDKMASMLWDIIVS